MYDLCHLYNKFRFHSIIFLFWLLSNNFLTTLFDEEMYFVNLSCVFAVMKESEKVFHPSNPKQSCILLTFPSSAIVILQADIDVAYNLVSSFTSIDGVTGIDLHMKHRWR